MKEFIEFAFNNAAREGKILCPCVKCTNLFWRAHKEVVDHLVCEGIMLNYTRWVFHGKASSSSTFGPATSTHDDMPPRNDMHGLLHDVFGISGVDDMPTELPSQELIQEELNPEAERFFRLLQDAEQALYLECKKFTKLSFVVRMYQLKCLNGWSNKSFTMLLELLKEALPEGETLPSSFYETKKIIKELGLSYNKIDACPNDCQLYWKTNVNDESCVVCGISRWKTMEHNSNDDEATTIPSKVKKIPAKTLWHFPLIPRLQRLFMEAQTAKNMKWHDKGQTKDECMRHPADSPVWKSFDEQHPNFSYDSRNVRLGLATDGFNPFGMMSIAHITWPVVLMPYNLPPWMCMKQPYIMMSLLMPGRHGVGNNIDVYLQPLIEELLKLWEVGVDTYDPSSKLNFRMCAALLWTISDFPGYAMLSGWNTKGKLACPNCNKDTESQWLTHSHKFCYMGHRRFLDRDHRYRHDKRNFNGKLELREMSKQLFGNEVLAQVSKINIIFGKKSDTKVRKKRNRDNNKEKGKASCWKKRSIFFDLLYWAGNMLRHSLDVMHIEKNVCDNVLGTLLNIDGKTKDNVKSRLDLQKIKIRRTLHPKQRPSGKTYLPPACFIMANKENDDFCRVIKNMKAPDGYASNISRCTNLKMKKILGLKSHDTHVLMQQILSIAVRRTLPPNVSSILIELSGFFRDLCSKVGRMQDFKFLESQIALTLCHLERIFPPSFFDIMVHLPIHLASEAMLAGPVQYRWMYPIERFHTRDHERDLKTQNSGVIVMANASSFASTSDRNPVIGDVDYYDVLIDIIELDYCGSKKVVLFRCDWVDVRTQGRGIKKDEFGFTLVNFKQLWHTGRNLYDEPYVLVTQVQQVFYVPDPIDRDWHVVIRSKPRDLFEMGMNDSFVDNDTYLQSLPCINHTLEATMLANNDNVSY
ncbi:uncharacterized protein LOC131255051 [Magnolia sinica]|uniref:uncharacterized protein LOC131255051 n=1 Tax=Magnolia sinica TaxID=86752 RepID=UPI002658A4E0|nr:uncharacterized protein LOC131255051 [Magnolia sinica]